MNNALRIRLYVAGRSPNSQLARTNLLRIVDRHRDRVESIEVIDVLEEPERALRDNVLVTPMLLRIAPEPSLEIVGNLANVTAIALALGLGEP